MATIDSLASDVAALNTRVTQIANQQSANSTSIHNLSVRTGELETKVAEHTTRLNEHAKVLENHENRISDIEDPIVFYDILPWKNECKLPSVNEYGEICIFLPPYTKEELRECNEDAPGIVQYKWWQKIFNPQYQGDVSFDFQDTHDYLESINLGPNSYIKLPLHMVIANANYPTRKFIIECPNQNLICTQRFYHIGEKQIITLYNYSNVTINIRTNDLLFRLTPMYGYETVLKRN